MVHTLSGYKIEGVSVGGQETCIVLHQLKLAFDSGRCPQRCVYADTMCLSHTHMDHVGGAGFYIATLSLISLPPPTIVLPASRTTAFAAFVDAMKALDGSDMPHVAVGLEPAAKHGELNGEHGVEPGTVSTGYRSRTTTTTTTTRADTTSEDAVTNGAPTSHRVSKRLVVRAFKTTHPTPSQGYVAYGTKEKLKTDYIGLPPSEIKALKASGVAITDTVEVPEVAFTGGHDDRLGGPRDWREDRRKRASVEKHRADRLRRRGRFARASVNLRVHVRGRQVHALRRSCVRTHAHRRFSNPRGRV